MWASTNFICVIAATASGGASERVPAPLAPFLVIPFKPSCGCSNLSGISDMRADLEAPIALQSPLKFPGCGGFVSSAAPAKLLERGGSDSSISCEVGSGLLVEFLSEVDGSSDGRSMFERSLLLGPCIDLWRMRSRSRLILSEIRRTWEATASGGASERVPAPLAPFLVIPFKPSCGCSDLSGGRSGRSSFQRRFWSRDVEAPIALQSPLKFPGCGGFVSSAAPAKLPERGGSDSSISCEVDSGLLAEFLSEVDGSSDGRSMFERSPLLGPCIDLWRMRSRSRLILSEIRRTWEVEAEVMRQIAMECDRHQLLSWA
ncbi:hypothetical protein F2Q69_00016384 [Brassica cretica]|uniref:Secreted protein n=1 Tax=Brassica cretica TaxID=69181 RepID=A0A8S9R0F0_BRACR|nr:hypothetical protein F2Q69_00016384 [Brassica cretica]